MMFFIGILIPYNDDRLLKAGSKAAKSPLTIALSDANIAPAAHLINALIILSVISAGNSSLYVASRTMLYLARNDKAPSFLGRVDRRGVPWAALLFSNAFACIAFISVSSNAGVVYEAIITLSGVATFLVWGTIEVVHIRFRMAMAVQGESVDSLPFKALWYPYGTYASLAANVFLVFFQGYTCFLNPWSPKVFVTNYILLPVFVIMIIAYKFWYKTKFVTLAGMDIRSGRREIEEEPEGLGAPKELGLVYWVTRIFVG
jgi:amino acid transporter